jgi:hypothetical protein
MSVAMLERALEVAGEAAIVLLFRSSLGSLSAPAEERIPLNKALDTVVYDMHFRFGRADIVIFHVDGSATVVEAKNGDQGYKNVVSGIGQAALYAAQLSMNKGALTRVRKALLWTSTGSIESDAAVQDACLLADTVPLPWGPLKTHLEATRSVLDAFKGAGLHDPADIERRLTEEFA